MLWATGDIVQAYFDRLSAVPPEAIAYFLYNLDLSAIDKTFPHTAYERMQKELAMSAIQLWWASVLKNKRFSNLYKLSDTAEIKVPTQVLQKSFDLWWSTHSRIRRRLVTVGLALWAKRSLLSLGSRLYRGVKMFRTPYLVFHWIKFPNSETVPCGAIN